MYASWSCFLQNRRTASPSSRSNGSSEYAPVFACRTRSTFFSSRCLPDATRRFRLREVHTSPAASRWRNLVCQSESVLARHFQEARCTSSGRSAEGTFFMVIDSWPDHGSAQVDNGAPLPVQVTQEVSQTHRVFLDGCATQPFATRLEICVDIANAELHKALMIATRTECSQKLKGMLCAVGPCAGAVHVDLASTRRIRETHVAVECLDGGYGRVGNGPRPCTNRSSM